MKQMVDIESQQSIVLTYTVVPQRLYIYIYIYIHFKYSFQVDLTSWTEDQVMKWIVDVGVDDDVAAAFTGMNGKELEFLGFCSSLRKLSVNKFFSMNR